MKGKPTYIGKIGNTGAQHVKAPVSPGTAKQGKVITGGDLRVGKSKK